MKPILLWQFTATDRAHCEPSAICGPGQLHVSGYYRVDMSRRETGQRSKRRWQLIATESPSEGLSESQGRRR